MIFNFILTFTGGLLAAGIGVAAGGGGIISVGVLTLLGLPLPMALATNRVGALSASMTALYKYNKAKKIDWVLAFKLLPLGIIGGLLGSELLNHTPTHLLKGLFISIIIVTIIMILFNPKIGLTETTKSKMINSIGYIVFLVLSLIGGLIGAGAGTIFIFMNSFFFGKTLLVAQATNMPSWLGLSLVASIVFASNNLVNIPLAIALLCGMSIGGYIGARLAILKGNKFIKKLMIVMLIIVAIQILLS
ncbi:sulfite exporter TauE/SafE family protein [Candidatus Saccharibacteria bacterium]|nr:sulfite exporter TauE/SafE family protein [Candidatus Saccharibacteria bacterium]